MQVIQVPILCCFRYESSFTPKIDAEKLSVAIANLILNGIQSIDGKGTIEIRLKENTDEILIKVEDSGGGIPQKDIECIFEPLFTTKTQGTGIGLSSVKFIIDAHDGTISVTSPPTIFTITLPKNLRVNQFP